MRSALRQSLLLSALLAFTILGSARLSHAGQEQAPPQEGVEEKSNPNFKWHLINTAIFAAGLGFALWKLAPGFFNARSADIQRAIKEATGLKMEADLRYSEIDRKMATLPEEVNRMKEQARIEMQREGERRRQETERELAHIQSTVAADIDAARAEAAFQIRQQTARLALQLAERRLREQASGVTDERQLQDFIHLVERGKSE